MQQGTNFDVLKIQRQLFAVVTHTGRQLVIRHLLLANLHNKLVIALVGRVLPDTTRLNHHANLASCLCGGHTVNRRAEIGDIQTATQAFRQARILKFNHQVLALTFDVNPNFVIGQVHHDATRIVRSSAEINAFQTQSPSIVILCKMVNGFSRWRHVRRRRQRNEQCLTIQAGFVASESFEVQDQPGTLATVRQLIRTQVALVHLLQAAGQLTADILKIQSDARRTLHTERAWLLRDRVFEVNANDFIAALNG